MKMMDKIRERFRKRQARMEATRAGETSAHYDCDQQGNVRPAKTETRAPLNRAERRAALHGQRSRLRKRAPGELVRRRAYSGIADWSTRQTLFWGCAIPNTTNRARLEA